MFRVHYLELILYRAYADLRAEGERFYISYFWWIFEPITNMVIFYVVFGLLLNSGTRDFVPFLLIGMTLWKWMDSTVTHGATTILGNVSMMRLAYLPKIIFPTVTIVTDTFKFTIVFVLLLIFLWAYGFPMGAPYLSLPLLLFIQFLFTVGLTYMVAAIVPFFPDLTILVQNLLGALFFMSGVFYAGSSLPQQYQTYFYLNPMACLIESFREVLMHNRWPRWLPLLSTGLISLCVIGLGAKIISRFDHIYPRLTK
jgi:lipopolysaccharide transport system permease protein